MTPSFAGPAPAPDSRPRAALVALAGWTLAASVLSLAPSWYMMEVYARVVDSRNLATLGMLTLAALALIAVLELVEWHRAETLREAGEALDAALAPRLFAQSFEIAQRQGAAAAAQALGHLHTVRAFIGSPAAASLLDAPTAVLYLALLWLLHPALCGVALAAAGAQAASTWLLDRRSRAPVRRGAEAGAAALRTADRLAEQAPVVAALGMREALGQRWGRLHSQARDGQAQAAALLGRHQALSRWTQQTVGSALLGAGCLLVLERQLAGGAGMLIVASILGGKVVSPLVQLAAQWNTLSQGRKSARELSRLIEAADAACAPMPLPAPRGQLSVEGLVVSVPGGAVRAPLLKGLNFRLQPGELLVVLGASGAGKTTLSRALVGVLAPSAGAVRLDGVDVSAWSRDELGAHLGYLPQRIDLLDGTVADNVARFGPRDDARLGAAVEAAGLAQAAQDWPQGLDTELGAGGAWLSGGLRQRVGLARALYGAPALVVLDEPNAHLDREGEAALAAALAALKARGCTAVVMSHRQGIVELADRLLVLRDGQQLAFGPREEVLAAMRQATAGAVRPAAAQPTARLA